LDGADLSYEAEDQPYSAADPPSDWAEDYVIKAVEYGLLPRELRSGFTDKITRGDYCTVLSLVLIQKDMKRFIEYEFPDTPPFTDTDAIMIGWLNSLGIVSGIGNNLFNPDGSITRQEAAIMLRRAALEFGVGDPGQGTAFADLDQADDWALEGLSFVSACGIMRGKDDNLFDPLGPYTREEAYITMVRMFDLVEEAVAIDDYMGLPPEPDKTGDPEPVEPPPPVQAQELSTAQAAAICPDAVEQKYNEPIKYDGIVYAITGTKFITTYDGQPVGDGLVRFVINLDISGVSYVDNEAHIFCTQTTVVDREGNIYTYKTNIVWHDELKAEFHYIVPAGLNQRDIAFTWPGGYCRFV